MIVSTLETKTENEKEGTINATKTPFHFIAHLFYNHLGVLRDDSAGTYTMPENQTEHDLNLLNSDASREIDEKSVSAFIELKNLLSLYGRNKNQFISKLSFNTHIIEDFLKKSRLKGMDSGLNNKEIANKFYDLISGDSASEKETYMIAEHYKLGIDDPFEKQNDDPTLHETNGNVFLRLTYKVKLADDSDGYITFGALPKLSTLLDPTKGNFKGSETGDVYTTSLKKYDDYLKSHPEKSFIAIKVLDDVQTNHGAADKLLDFYTGIRTSKLTDTPIEVDHLASQGIRTEPEIKIFPKNINEIIKIFTTYGLNWDKATLETIEGLKTSLESFKGCAYIIAGFTDESGESFKKVVPLVAKSRNFETLLNEYQEIVKNKHESKSLAQEQVAEFLGLPKAEQEKKVKELKTVLDIQRKNLFNKYTGTVMLFDVLNDSNMKSLGLENFIKSFSDYIIKPFETVYPKNQNVVDLIDAIGKIMQSNAGTDKTKLSSIIDLIKQESTKNVNLGQYLLGYITKYSDIKYESTKLLDPKGVETDITMKNIVDNMINALSNATDSSKKLYYFNATPEGNTDKETKNLKINTDYSKNFEVRTMIEMPRALVNLEKTLKGDIVESNTEKVETIQPTPVEIKDDTHIKFYSNYLGTFEPELQNSLKNIFEGVNIESFEDGHFEIQNGGKIDLYQLDDILTDLVEKYPNETNTPEFEDLYSLYCL